MSKILDLEFREALLEMLIESGAPQKEAEDTVKKRFKECLKKETIKTLQKMIYLIENDKFSEAEEMLAFSGAGDGYGSDNSYIMMPNGDIGDVLDELKN